MCFLDILYVVRAYRLSCILFRVLPMHTERMSRFILYLRIKAAAVASIGAAFFLLYLPKFG